MKTLSLILSLLALSTLTACETSPPSQTVSQSSAVPQGKTLGNSDIHVSGGIEAGGSVSNR